MKLRLTINGKTYDVDVEILDEAGEAAAPAAAVTGARPHSAPQPPAPVSASPGARELRAPLPGTVLEVRCAPGQAVRATDTLVILDAMKMNTQIASPLDGTVKEILVRPGEPVRMGQVMVTFE